MRRLTAILATAATAAAAAPGCYTTEIRTNLPAEDHVHEDRQWFLIGGLVDLSDPAAANCPEGIAWAESEASGIDIVIGVGLTIAGGLVGTAACSGIDSDEARGGCISGFASLPHIFGSRTVQYRCVSSLGVSALHPHGLHTHDNPAIHTKMAIRADIPGSSVE